MSNAAPQNPGSKYAWCEVDAQGPPKRSATDRVADFLEVYGPFDEATARAQASRCIQCPEPTCVAGCPLSNRIPEWMLLTAEGQFLEAAALAHATSNMPEICARVCPKEHLCEGMCILGTKDAPVSIGAIEQFVNEYALAHGAIETRVAPPNGFRVAICGAGPAGLACADELIQRGYAVTVFDARLFPGGLLVGGIPAFKLEKSVVQRRVDILKQRGVEFRLGVNVGTDITLGELRDRFDAVFLGFGAQKARALEVPGAGLSGVVQALPFLVQKNTDLPSEIPPLEISGKRVVVIGGGDTAMDCLRTALRCGAREAVCLYRRDKANMPGSSREYDNALEEGARFVFLTAPTAVLSNERGDVAGLRLVRTRLGAPDPSGRRQFSVEPNSEHERPADLILLALGFEPVSFPLANDLSSVTTTRWKSIAVDANQMTNVPGVFAGGDVVRGPSLVGHAVRDARKAAAAIHEYLSARKPARALVVA
jgi:glutamate synthase (NADPH) small chain